MFSSGTAFSLVGVEVLAQRKLLPRLQGGIGGCQALGTVIWLTDSANLLLSSGAQGKCHKDLLLSLHLPHAALLVQSGYTNLSGKDSALSPSAEQGGLRST